MKSSENRTAFYEKRTANQGKFKQIFIIHNANYNIFNNS